MSDLLDRVTLLHVTGDGSARAEWAVSERRGGQSMQRTSATVAFAAAMAFVLISSEPAVRADTSGPSAADLLTKVDAAMGGESVRTEISTISTTIDGKYATVTMMMKRPNRFLERFHVPQAGASLTIGVVGSTAWMQTADGQVRVADLGEKDVGLAVVSSLYSPSSWKHVTRLADRDYLAGTYYVLHVIPKTGPAIDMLIDKQTYEPIASQVTIKGAVFTEAYTDFTRGPGGEAYPRHIRFIGPNGTTLRVDTITSLDDNVPIDDASFAPPDR